METLYNKVKDKISIQLDIDQLILLDQLYIDARYPGGIGLLPNVKPSTDDSKQFYDLAKIIYEEVMIICK